MNGVPGLLVIERIRAGPEKANAEVFDERHSVVSGKRLTKALGEPNIAR
jgi:hypothetical protein